MNPQCWLPVIESTCAAEFGRGVRGELADDSDPVGVEMEEPVSSSLILTDVQASTSLQYAAKPWEGFVSDGTKQRDARLPKLQFFFLSNSSELISNSGGHRSGGFGWPASTCREQIG